ncbi:hypothetical protein AVEN_115679-1 [Araneus ventricosus]|uniref:Uncharacterized protein n=1 Tax=Araneus ventricosus TaxID=182803 RepID=A0A4Y2I5K3_ARAVE|nr:hypothetical protein AVEN_115679-1 [Araneus ventricosus]
MVNSLILRGYFPPAPLKPGFWRGFHIEMVSSVQYGLYPTITLPAIPGNKAVSVLLLLISSRFFRKCRTQAAQTEMGCEKDPNKDNWTSYHSYQ